VCLPLQLRNLVNFLCELSLLDIRFVSVRPSQVAAAAVHLALAASGNRDTFPRLLRQYSSYTLSQVRGKRAMLPLG